MTEVRSTGDLGKSTCRLLLGGMELVGQNMSDIDLALTIEESAELSSSLPSSMARMFPKSQEMNMMSFSMQAIWRGSLPVMSLFLKRQG